MGDSHFFGGEGVTGKVHTTDCTLGGKASTGFSFTQRELRCEGGGASCTAVSRNEEG